MNETNFLRLGPAIDLCQKRSLFDKLIDINEELPLSDTLGIKSMFYAWTLFQEMNKRGDTVIRLL